MKQKMDFFLLLVDLPFYAKQETIFPVTVQQQKHSSKNKHNFKECLSIRSGFIEWKTTNMEKNLKMVSLNLLFKRSEIFMLVCFLKMNEAHLDLHLKYTGHFRLQCQVIFLPALYTDHYLFSVFSHFIFFLSN